MNNEQRTTNNKQRIIQNKANFLDTLMNVKSILTKDYENKSNWTLGENKPKTKPIKPNSKGKKMLPEPNLLTSAEPGLHQRI